MPLSAPGIGSNLDVNGLVTQLMSTEKRPLDALNLKEASIQARLSAFGSLKSALSGLKNSMQSLREAARFEGFRASLGDSSIASVSIAGRPAPGTHALEVTQLAQAQKLKSAAFAETTTTVGSGKITIQFGDYTGGTFALNPDRATQTITIDPGSDSLAAVRDAINASAGGVSASIINDGSGNRLLINGNAGGTANAMRITVEDADGNNTDASGLSQLAYDASTGGTARLAEAAAAKDALFTIDGIAVRKSSNTITDVLAGVTLQLNATNTGKPTTLSIAKDTGATTGAVEAFAKSWNDTARTLRDLSAYNATTKQGAILQGDATLLGIQGQLRSVLGQALGGGTTLGEVGVEFDANGGLAVNGAKLSAALAAGRNIGSWFAATGTATDGQISLVSSDGNAAAGELGIQITQAAARGTATGSQAAGLAITAGVNDTFDLTVDGNQISVTLGAGSYTPASLAAELESRINGALSGGAASVDVTETNGVLGITSRRYGSASVVSPTGGTALATLFGTAVEQAGTDVAGFIGGVQGTGSGQNLTAAGLVVQVGGTATGDRGTLNFSRGYADQLYTLTDRLMAADGAIGGRTTGIDSSLKDIAAQREKINTRLAEVEKRYRAQFTALDTLLSRMTQTSNFLTNQLASLPKIGS